MTGTTTGTDRWLGVAAGSGVLGGTAWVGKVLALWATGTEGGVDVPLFAVGLFALLVAATGPGLWLARRRGIGWRMLGAALGVPLALGGFVLVQIVAEPLNPSLPTGVAGEIGILVAALVAVVLGTGHLRRRLGTGEPAVSEA